MICCHFPGTPVPAIQFHAFSVKKQGHNMALRATAGMLRDCPRSQGSPLLWRKRYP